MALEAGLSAEAQVVVTADMTADRLGNPGLMVFATPALVRYLEEVSVKAVSGHLDEGALTVGTRVDVEHLAATPVGATIRFRSDLTSVDGRKLTFSVTAHDATEQIGRGTHERMVLDRSRFLERVAAKEGAT